MFDELKNIIDDVKRHFDGANVYIQEHPDVTEYIGEDWGKNAEKCQLVLASQDYYLTMATYGVRLYKDLSMKKVSGFNISVYKEIVAKVLNVYSALKSKYNQPVSPDPNGANGSNRSWWLIDRYNSV